MIKLCRSMSRTTALAGLVPAATAAALALASTAFAGAPAPAVSRSARVAATAQAKLPVPVPVKGALVTLIDNGFNLAFGFFDESHWRQAVAESAMESYHQTTGDTNYDYTFNSRQMQTFPVGFFENAYNDDTGWWGLALLQAYQINHNRSYLTRAEAIASYIAKSWNTTTECGGVVGGIPWHRPGPDFGYTGAIQNGLFLELTAWLHNTIVANGGKDSGPNSYLGWAMREWKYFQATGLFHSTAIRRPPSKKGVPGFAGPPVLEPYWVPNAMPRPFTDKNHPNGKPTDPACGSIRYRIYTYNQGVLIAGLAQLYTATKTLGYLTDAEDIADAVLKPPTAQQSLAAAEAFFTGASPWIFTFFGGGVLIEPQDPLFSTTQGLGDGAAFKGIFVRDLRMLYDTIMHAPAKANQCAATYKNKTYGKCTTMYKDFFTTQACSIEANDTTNAPVTSINPEGATVRSDHVLGDRWQGPAMPHDTTTQVSAVEAFVAAIMKGQSFPNCRPGQGSSGEARQGQPTQQTQHRGPGQARQAVQRCARGWYRMPGCRQEHEFGRGSRFFHARHEHFGREGDQERDD